VGSVSRLRYEVFGRSIEVVVDAPALVQPLAHLFPAYSVPAPAEGGGAPVVLTVDAQDGTYTVSEGQVPPRLCRSLAELLSVSEFAITRALLARCTDHLPLHASGAVVNGRGVIALGRPGAGKSSLAISWHRDGHPALGDDVVLVDQTATVHPFKRLYEVDVALLPDLGLEPHETPFWEDGSTEAWYDPGNGAGWASPTSVAVIAIARHQPGAALSLERLSHAATLNFLLHSHFERGTRDATADRLVSLSRGTEGYVVTFGAAREAARAIAEIASTQ